MTPRLPADASRPEHLFPVGEVRTTYGVEPVLVEMQLAALLTRHVSGDWGDLGRGQARERLRTPDRPSHPLALHLGRERPYRLDHHRMGSQRDDDPAPREVLAHTRLTGRVVTAARLAQLQPERFGSRRWG
jgi:hypothetical protein